MHADVFAEEEEEDEEEEASAQMLRLGGRFGFTLEG
jgi:hypothetical protein